jgi:single-strand DNA-binding protein
MNTITINGNVGRDPELRYTQQGKAIAKFSVADSRGKDDKKETTWHNVVCFDEMAENICEAITKGARVVVIGRLVSNEYTDKEGVKRTAWDVLADDVCLSLRFKPKAGMGAAPQRAEAHSSPYSDEDPF